jgi:MauM/NapG family ferredoxin protein
MSIMKWITNFISPSKDKRIDLGRRNVIGAAVAGLAGGMLMKGNPLDGGRTYDAGLIRPPGSAAEDEFLDKCIRCGECMKVCPTNVIQATMLEAGLEGLWSPILKTELGYCEYKCNMCTQVCPTDAIAKLTLIEKQKVKVGLAFVDKSRCLPYAYARLCQVCYEQCPLPEKAIRLEDATVTTAKGTKLTVKQPHVSADLCIGCGICQNKCPVSDQAAIRVMSGGETRNLKNQFLHADYYSGLGL